MIEFAVGGVVMGWFLFFSWAVGAYITRSDRYLHAFDRGLFGASMIILWGAVIALAYAIGNVILN